MNSAMRRLRRVILPLAAFLVVVTGHFVLRGLYGEHDPAQDRWVTVQTSPRIGWVDQYLEAQNYWMGISYGMCGGFVVWAVRLWREQRRRAAGVAAIGGSSLGGMLAVAGCFLTGCCGSPMLAVYIGLLGAWFLPLAKPLCAVITFLSLLVGWWWINRRLSAAVKPCTDRRCSCNEWTRN